MRNIIYVILSLMLLNACNIKINKTVIDERTKNKVLIGKCDRQAFDQTEFKGWYENAYNEYEPDQAIISKLIDSENFKTIQIKLIFGTWCGDSRREIPRFYKIIDQTNFPDSRIELIGVDTKKSSRNKQLVGIEFTRIPTFIIYKDKKEIGRIVESTEINLESDLFAIIEK